MWVELYPTYLPRCDEASDDCKEMTLLCAYEAGMMTGAQYTHLHPAFCGNYKELLLFTVFFFAKPR